MKWECNTITSFFRNRNIFGFLRVSDRKLTPLRNTHKIENTIEVTCFEWRRAVLLWKKGFVKDVDTWIKFNS
jgi:hypothetical protein